MRLSHLTAVAVMIALVGAMFVALAPAMAHDLGECDNPEYLNAATCRENVKGDYDDNAETADTAFDPNAHQTADDPWTSLPHNAENHSPSISIAFGDSDGVVAADSTLRVTVTTSGILATTVTPAGLSIAAGAIELQYVRVSGELDHPEQSDSTADGAGTLGDLRLAPTPSGTDDMSASAAIFDVVIPDGTTPGEYTVSTRISGIDYDGEAVTNRSASKSFRVADPGTGLATAVLSLGNRVSDNKGTVADESRPESGSDVADGTFNEQNPKGINLVVTAMNSMGEASNDRDVNQITVIAPGGDITIHPPAGVTLGDNPSAAEQAQYDAYTDTDTDSASISEYVAETSDTGADEVRQTIHFTVSKDNKKPGSVDVYVILTGSGAAVSETVTLNFTGDASAVAIGEASGSLHNQFTDDPVGGTDNRDKITFAVSANDAGGNNAGVAKGTVRVFDPKGVRVGTDVIKTTQGPDAAGAPNSLITLETLKKAPGSIPAGEYTVKLTAAGNSAEQTFNVTGTADAITLNTESSTDEIALGSVITVTAEVTSGGIAVAEKTLVTFTPAGALKLAYVGVGDKAQANTKAGTASVQFVVSEGSGLASIIVTAGNASATTSVSTEAADAMPEEEASVSCLSELSGFATWSCGVEADASEIFDMVSGRGVTALHLWNGSTWVRYSVVDGAMVPGSSDFMVTENDILYISN